MEHRTNDNFLLIFYIYISLKTSQIRKLCWFVTTENAKWENNSSELQYLEFRENFPKSYARVQTNKTWNMFWRNWRVVNSPRSPRRSLFERGKSIVIPVKRRRWLRISQNFLAWPNFISYFKMTWQREIKWLNIPW